MDDLKLTEGQLFEAETVVDVWRDLYYILMDVFIMLG